MPFVQAKCPECGGMLAVDDSKKAANCQFCGEAFIVQEAVNNYNTYNTYNTNHNYGEGAVVNIYEDKSKDFVIEAGVLKEYHGASVDVVIPDGVLEIGDNCFKGLKIKSVIIPNSVITIGVRAFYWCTCLTSIKIPSSITGIGSEAFNGCANLSGVHINDLAAWCNIIFNGSEANPLTFANNLYLNNELITDLILPDSVTSIGQAPFGGFTFSGCTSITSVTISNSVKTIGHCAFEGCSNLVSVKIPSSVTTMLTAVFRNCTNLQSVTIPDSVTSIGNHTFEGCPNLKNLNTSIDLLTNNKNAFSEELSKTIFKKHGLCEYCGGTFKGLLFPKCIKCGCTKDY